MSETKAVRSMLSKFCTGFGIDIGFGGSAIVPEALTFDLPKGYCPSFEGHKQILKGDCKNLSFFCDEVFDYVYSSHLLEDFFYSELILILKEWRRVLKKGGLLITNCPDQQKFLNHCRKTGQPINLAHKEQDFSLQKFKEIADKTGCWDIIFEEPNAGSYSFCIVLKKV